MLASDKSYQLSIALQSMATRLSFEDVQIIARTIAQSAANVLTVRILSMNLYELILYLVGCE
jgi:hypothetical protein